MYICVISGLNEFFQSNAIFLLLLLLPKTKNFIEMYLANDKLIVRGEKRQPEFNY